MFAEWANGLATSFSATFHIPILYIKRISYPKSTNRVQAFQIHLVELYDGDKTRTVSKKLCSGL